MCKIIIEKIYKALGTSTYCKLPVHCMGNLESIQVFLLLTATVYVEMILLQICNSNWTEWSTIQGAITQVISKLDEHEARGRFEITSTIAL